MGRSSEAFDDARLATIDDLLYVKAHWRMGQAVMANGDVTGALLSFERAMNLEPNNGALRKEIEMARARMAREEEEEHRCRCRRHRRRMRGCRWGEGGVEIDDGRQWIEGSLVVVDDERNGRGRRLGGIHYVQSRPGL